MPIVNTNRSLAAPSSYYTARTHFTNPEPFTVGVDECKGTSNFSPQIIGHSSEIHAPGVPDLTIRAPSPGSGNKNSNKVLLGSLSNLFRSSFRSFTSGMKKDLVPGNEGEHSEENASGSDPPRKSLERRFSGLWSIRRRRGNPSPSREHTSEIERKRKWTSKVFHIGTYSWNTHNVIRWPGAPPSSTESSPIMITRSTPEARYSFTNFIRYPEETRDGPSDSAPICRNMTAVEVVSCLVEHGCQDLSRNIVLSTFNDYPIAVGGLSDIYRGRLSSGELVAVKALRVSTQTIGGNLKHLKHAARELHTWSKCNHPNVIPLLGMAKFRGRIGMVSPWMDKGSIPEYLKANPANRGDLCIQICEGLTYLHRIGIIHGDLKGHNVLVSDGGVPVLADFGNSTLKDQTLKFTQTTSSSALTVRWSAPELINKTGTSVRTKSSDIYALGMTLYEVMTGKVPYYNEEEPAAVILLVVLGKSHPERPVCMLGGHISERKLWDLFVQCWSYEPGIRPSAAKVAETLKAINLKDIVYLVS